MSFFINFFFNTVKLLTNNMQRFISKIVLFNKTYDRGLIISNFEKGGLHFSLFTSSYQNCLKRWMSRPKSGFIFLKKNLIFLSHSNDFLKLHLLKHSSFQENQRTKYVFSIDASFLFISF